MYRVFPVEEKDEKTGEQKYEIFWCPSAPTHYNDRVPFDGRKYTKRQAAYRRSKQLNDQRQSQQILSNS